MSEALNSAERGRRGGAQGGDHDAAQAPGVRREDLAARAAELDHGLHGWKGGRGLCLLCNSGLPAQDHFCVAVEGRATLAAHHLLGLQEIQAHLQALSASPWRPDHAATGLIRRQGEHKADEIDRRERGG